MIKNIIKTLSVTVLVTTIFIACGSKQIETEKKVEVFKCKQDGAIAPKWTCNPYSKNSIAALGIAKANAGNDKSLQRSEAMADGRDALASQIETKVSNLFKSYRSTTGSGDDSTFDASSSKVSKQLADQSLSGTRAINSWMNPITKELYLLVTIPNDSIKDYMSNTIRTSYKNDQAMYQKFLASKAQGELDKELESVQAK